MVFVVPKEELQATSPDAALMAKTAVEPIATARPESVTSKAGQGARTFTLHAGTLIPGGYIFAKQSMRFGSVPSSRKTVPSSSNTALLADAAAYCRTTAVGAEAGAAKGDWQSLRELPQKAAP